MELKKKERLVLHYLDISRVEKAIDILKELLRYEPNNGYYEYLMGICLRRIGEINESIEMLESAISDGFSEEECFENLGFIYYDINDIENAVKHFNLVLNVNPRNSNVLAIYGRLIYETRNSLKQKKESDRIIEEALRIDPYNKFVLYHSFYYYLHSDNILYMERIFKEYMRVSSNEKVKNTILGEMELYKNNNIKARNYFKDAFLLDPTDRYLLEKLKELKTIHMPVAYIRGVLRKFKRVNKRIVEKSDNIFLQGIISFFLYGAAFAIYMVAFFALVFINLFISFLLGLPEEVGAGLSLLLFVIVTIFISGAVSKEIMN